MKLTLGTGFHNSGNLLVFPFGYHNSINSDDLLKSRKNSLMLLKDDDVKRLSWRNLLNDEEGEND